MVKRGNQKTMIVAIIGSIIVALVLIAGTYWSGKSAEKATETAVRNVSLLYLDELAGRREQVVASTLTDYINDLDVAIGLMTSEDLSSVESLQNYQLRMKQLYNLEKFAFVDKDGLIYTSRGTRTDINRYSFDVKTLGGPEISLKKVDGESKKLIVAVPVDNLPFMGKELVVCFMEKDIASMTESISLQTGNLRTTFCNIYTADGFSLTNVVLGGLAGENNLLEALSKADFEKGHSLSAMKSDFHAHKQGTVSFVYNGIKETMCYVPIHNTDWMLTYLIRESIISEQISTISDGIIKNCFF